MQEIFQLPKPKKKRFTGFKENEVNETKEFLNSIGLHGEAAANSVSPLTSRFHSTLRSASSCGQFEKLAQGMVVVTLDEFRASINLSTKKTIIVL